MSQKRQIWAWACYDWANSAYATTVMAAFFPVFFKQYWAADLPATESTFWLGAANSTASLIVVLMAPLLGAIADRGGLKKRLLATFAWIGVLSAGGLFLVGEGHWPWAWLLFVLGALGFSGGNVFYDALLLDVAPRDRLEKISSLGFGVGYLGGGILFAINIWMVTSPETFGFTDAAEALRAAFLTVAIWWALFSIPILIVVHEGQPKPWHGERRVWRAAFIQLRETLLKIRRLRMALYFLLAYWFYIDAVDTVFRMAVDYGLSIGLTHDTLLGALLLTQFVAFPAALLFGWLGHKHGPKLGIWIGIAVYVVSVFWAYRMQSAWEFFALAAVIGFVTGGIQALSRALFARMIPDGMSAEFFGFYNMLGKFAAVLGPILVGWTALLTGEVRSGILAVLVLLIPGAVFLAKVDPKRGELEARDFTH